MHIHILGICGTFMGGIAVIARQAGHTVTGCDENVYPPMSTQLEQQGIRLTEGWDPHQTELCPDLYVIGNVVSRGNRLMEAILDRGLPYVSGPQWLAETLLRNRWVLAVAGTHGKTTTASMLAWILEDAGLRPGFLIGGVPMNFGLSARITDSHFFVIEADEYDTAFFDKRSKFVHYRPRTAVLNNLEFDHADIFPDLGAIETQFHHLVRTVPGNGLIVANGAEAVARPRDRARLLDARRTFRCTGRMAGGSARCRRRLRRDPEGRTRGARAVGSPRRTQPPERDRRDRRRAPCRRARCDGDRRARPLPGHARLSGRWPAAAWPRGVPTRGGPLVYPPVDAPPGVGMGHAFVGAGHARESDRSG
jgi:hypothetical protein